VSKTGRRFHIDRAVVWNLFDDRRLSRASGLF